MARPGQIWAGIAGGALLAATPAWATQSGQTPQTALQTRATDVSGVTVTAPEKPSPLVNPETQFVRSHLAQNRNQQYARFRDPVCVRVIGLPAEFDAFVARRVTALANRVHAPIDRSAACTPNVNVIFSQKPQAQLDDIAKRRDILFGFHFAADLKKLTTFDRPIQAWYLTREVGTEGASVLELNHGVNFRDGGPGAPPVSLGVTVNGRAGSRLGNDMSSELVHALIIADANKLADAKIGAVADYIALLALSRWQDLERCNAIPTILNLEAEGCANDPPETATASDVALLRALYALDPRETGAQQRITMATRMQSERQKANAEQH
ncbi:MAG TPA: hypothetical protein VFE18_13445 [Phenylobacterium sp.]|jgi:hypothetical protein|uniref:hypothetical protein n=1 Tax=Phenylobacterium sp. TaxID=1871053 RepID=UPI002D568ADD|nr:hypothetical protein [Phenylobacterium sp.]HZZ69171.1 hypothetical protein [Phenylobacterium sp.]